MMSFTKESGKMASSMESASKKILMIRSILDLGSRERKMDMEGSEYQTSKATLEIS